MERPQKKENTNNPSSRESCLSSKAQVQPPTQAVKATTSAMQ